MDYETMRQMADSWGLLYLVISFVAIIAFTFRPGSKKTAEQIAQIPLKEDREDVG